MTNKVKLTIEGRAIVRLNMKPLNALKLERVFFKLDTGADLTTISKKDLGALGYDANWIQTNTIRDLSRSLSSAGGRSLPANYITIPISNLFGRDFKNWPFYIRVETDRDFPNLLGIYVMSNFNFTFNYDTGYLEVDLAKAPIITLPMFSEQGIGELRCCYETMTEENDKKIKPSK